MSEDKRWREFTDWVQSMVELENREVLRSLRSATLERKQGRRDAFEELWVVLLAFNEFREQKAGEREKGKSGRDD